MVHGYKVAVVMPAYYAEKTVERTVNDIPRDVVDEIILVDDASKDDTVAIAQSLEIQVYRNETNQNYGGNLKRCFQYALDSGADIIIQLHPDYQYSPKLLPAIAGMLATGFYGVCLASRTSGVGALSGGMPVWRYLANWGLTNFMDVCLGTRHTEYHTGYRGYTREVLETVPFRDLRDDFIFDNQMLVAAMKHGFATSEVTCPTSYEEDASSIGFGKAVRYGIQCVKLSLGHYGWRLSGSPEL